MKLDKIELEYIQELLNDETRHYVEVGKAYYNKLVLDANIADSIKKIEQSKKDFNKKMKKLEDKYGSVNINLADGSIQEIEKNEQSS
jgi:hypothetical protein|tara:strand:+ start:323 stop:583 length:261 start_codon:yes stop_codon:yes gene_type:complete